MRIPTWFVLIWVVAVGVIAVGASAVAYTFVRDRAAELDTVLELPDPPQFERPAANDSPTATPTPPAAPVDTGNNASGSGGTAEPAPSAVPANATSDPGDTASAANYAPIQDPRRKTVLLLGIDQRAGEQGPFPTDTIMLLSLDPVGKTGAILSIPRDLWVEYPGLGRSGKINAANIVGDEISYPGGGGPAFAVRAVEKELGVPIHYYVLINFEVFTTFIDAIGPIEVCPPEAIDDDKYPDGSYGYITIHFDPGCQELDAERLLQYARTRHADSDIGRSSRQQEVILAVRRKVLTTGGVMALIPRAAELWESLQDNIRTNMTFQDMAELALKAEEVPSENIRQDQIMYEDVQSSVTADGEDILVPISSDIHTKVADLFRPAGAPPSSP
jgi:LCP family protein required for cell wall assembly